MTDTIESEVLVVGGGPAGAACALTLARLERSVVLCEAVSFPRDHIGVCLSPGVIHQLEFLGLADVLLDPAHRPDVPIERRWESNTFVAASSTAIIADRGRLDSDLLAAAADCGVRVLQPGRIGHLTRQAEGWTTDVAVPSGMRRIRAAIVVDARGRSSANFARRRLGAPTVALHGHWRGDAPAVVRIGAAQGSWSWAAPIREHRHLAIAFTSPRTLRRLGGSLGERYRRLLDEAGVLRLGLELDAEPRVCDATPYVGDDNEPGYLRIGDASAALDPLSSSGVQAAIQSGLCAGPVVNTLLTRGAEAAAAIEYWKNRRSARTAIHHTWSTKRYAEVFGIHNSDFWAVRAAADAAHGALPGARAPLPKAPLPSPDQMLRLSDKVEFVRTPCLLRGLVVRAVSLLHPNLGEPVAFIEDVPVHSVLAVLSTHATAAELFSSWKSVFSLDKALRLLGWLWRNEIAVAC